MMTRDLEDFEHVDEDHIRRRAEATKSPSLNHLLKIADEWREAECTPVFIIAQEEPMVIACVCKETFGQYYH